MKVLESLRLKLRRGELATLPFVMQSLLSALSDPHSSAKQLGRVIETDQALSASVLRLANSAYYGLSQQVSDMQQAVTLVGYSALRELVMSITSYDLIFRSGSVTYDRQELWSHSLQVACGSRVLARRFPKVPQEVVFVAGILHDVGMTLMDQHAHSLFVTIVSTAKQMNQSQYAVEKNLVGVTHAEVGQWAAEAWNLPPVLQSAIRYHHDPQNAGPHRLAASIVAMADALCHDPYTLDTDEVALMRQVGDFLGLPEPDWPLLRNQIASEASAMSSVLSLPGKAQESAGAASP